MEPAAAAVRAVILTAAACAAAVLLVPAAAGAVAQAVATPVEVMDPATLVGGLALALGALGAAWLALASAALVAEAAAVALGAHVPALPRVSRAVAPRFLRRLVVVGLGATLGLAPQLAAAAEVDLGWTSDTTSDAATTAEAALQDHPATPASPDATPVSAPVLPDDDVHPETVTVKPRDTLWALTRERLRSTVNGSPSDARIAQAWPALWSANRAVIGEDPDLLRPGQVLTLPDLTLPTARTAENETDSRTVLIHPEETR